MEKAPIFNEPNDLVRERLKKFEAVKAKGIDPFGGRFPKEAFLAQLAENFAEGKIVRAAGRLSSTRVMGKSVFCDLKDESGRMQIYLKHETLGEEGFSLFENLDLGDIVGVEGELFKTKTGEITIRAQKLILLSKGLRPLPEKWHGLKDVESRYRHRYLDLISNDETKEIFKKRSLIIRAIRKILDDKGYLEVETPMMHPIPGGAAGRPFKTHHEALGMDLYLRVAPELYLKRLLVGGFDRVYEINKSFRNEGISTRHNPEFTMLEVYTAYQDVGDVMNLTEELVTKTAEGVFGSRVLQNGDSKLDLNKWERVSFAWLMQKSFGIEADEPLERWVEKLKKKGVKLEGKDISRTQLINIVAELIDPAKQNESGTLWPIFVTDYFSELSPLARRRQENPHLSDRFELYIGGMEVANGYSEQNDPLEQRERFVEALEEKERTSDHVDEDYLFALEHGMPPAGGLGIGIDRLIMVLTGQPSIRDVILFPQLKPEKSR